MIKFPKADIEAFSRVALQLGKDFLRAKMGTGIGEDVVEAVAGAAVKTITEHVEQQYGE